MNHVVVDVKAGAGRGATTIAHIIQKALVDAGIQTVIQDADAPADFVQKSMYQRVDMLKALATRVKITMTKIKRGEKP